MFGKKECKRCNVKSSSKYNFCPNCGVPFNGKKTEDDYGMLGEDDADENLLNVNSNFFSGISGKMMGKMFESAVKMLEREMQKEMKKSSPRNLPKQNFQLFVNGKKINVNQEAKRGEQKQKIKRELSQSSLPNANLKKFGDFPKKEPETNVRRFSDRVIYEINMPGLKSEKEMSIVKMENSIEIKALADNIIYRKIIPISLPITDFKIANDKLVLELGLKE